MIYTSAKTVDAGRVGYQEYDALKRIFKIQYETEHAAILYDPIYQDKLYLIIDEK